VIERLRELADRPIADPERRRLFALVTAVVVLAGALMPLPPDPQDERPSRAPATVSTVPAPRRALSPISDGSAERSGPTVAIELAARRFLAGYLRFLYGQGSARRIEAASPRLRLDVERSRVRVSPAARGRHPRIAALEVRQTTASARFAISAEIADGGVARFPIELTVARRGSGWSVVEVSGH
jgi:hypothetical protein